MKYLEPYTAELHATFKQKKQDNNRHQLKEKYYFLSNGSVK